MRVICADFLPKSVSFVRIFFFTKIKHFQGISAILGRFFLLFLYSSFLLWKFVLILIDYFYILYFIIQSKFSWALAQEGITICERILELHRQRQKTWVNSNSLPAVKQVYYFIASVNICILLFKFIINIIWNIKFIIFTILQYV